MLETRCKKPIPEKGKGSAEGWIFAECEGNPPCLGWYEKFSVTDQSGKTYSQVITLDEVNKVQGENVYGLRVQPSYRVPKLNMDSVRLLRPFPINGYRSEPSRRGDFVKI